MRLGAEVRQDPRSKALTRLISIEAVRHTAIRRRNLLRDRELSERGLAGRASPGSGKNDKFCERKAAARARISLG